VPGKGIRRVVAQNRDLLHYRARRGSTGFGALQ
jgi:hypothetical protein